MAREFSLDIEVALPPVGAEVLGDVHRARVRGAGDFHDLTHGIAPAQLQPSDAHPQIGQARLQISASSGARGTAQGRVQHEERNDLGVCRVRERGQQRGIVGQSEVAPEPHDAGHLIELARSSRRAVEPR